MTDLFQEPEDATPLEPEEREELLLNWVTTRAELNLVEQDNIDVAAAWLIGQRSRPILTVEFALRLHRKMFEDVWGWAGQYRQTERNIGIAPHRIGADMAALFDNARFWQDNETYAPDELAVRLHHQLVFIHPFPNGNGRHARMMADLLIKRLDAPAFTWGSGSLGSMGELRTAYIKALRAADNHDLDPLIAFART